jgi:NAD(P)-dependent dehydrogenase (short-subunit alcohol dehydrogenase family)
MDITKSAQLYSFFMNRTFVITGGASGIGLSTARQLHLLGAKVALWDVNKTALDQVSDVYTCCVDITDPESVLLAAQQTTAELGPLYGVVHSAGVLYAGPFEHIPPEDHRRLITINLFGSTVVAQVLLPYLRQTRGSLIFLASVAAFAESGEFAVYSAVKAGIVALADTLRVELKGSGIHIGVVAPMFVQTSLLDGAIQHTRLMQGFGASHTPEQVATAIVKGIVRRRHFIWPNWQPWLVYQLGRWLPRRLRSNLWWMLWNFAPSIARLRQREP